MKIIPAIDIKNGKCVRLIQGDYGRETIYGNSPIEMAKNWITQGAEQLHLVDLDGAKDGRLINEEEMRSIVKSVSVPVQVGGGIRSIQSIEKLIGLGVSKIILGTISLDTEGLLDVAMKAYGEKIVVSLDAFNGSLMTNGWMEKTEKKLIPTLKALENKGIRSIIYTDTERDGTLLGPNYEVIRSVMINTTMKVIVAGGISSQEQIKLLKGMNIEGVIIGKALYERKINLKEALNYVN